MVFWIGAAIAIFICSLIWALISMRSVIYDEEQADAGEQLPPQPKARTAESIPVQVNTMPAQTAVAMVPNTSAVTQIQQSIPSQSEQAPTAAPKTIEEARERLQHAIAQSGYPQTRLSETASSVQPQKIAPAIPLPSQHPTSVEITKPIKLGAFLGEIKIQRIQ